MKVTKEDLHGSGRPYTQEEFINKIKTDDEFAKKWGELGPVYGKQWRSWEVNEPTEILRTESVTWPYEPNPHTYQQRLGKFRIEQIDQIQNLINELKTNPDSRRMVVSAWAVHDLPHQVLPPCHYGFQVYTRELSLEERVNLTMFEKITKEHMDELGVPTRAISLMWNQRSVDTFLGLPFNIASYGLLLEILAKEVNMVPDELIGNLGDVHLYSNHIEQAKEQIGRELTFDERYKIYSKWDITWEEGGGNAYGKITALDIMDESKIPTRTREPYPLPKLQFNPIFLANLEHKSFDEAINGQINFELENYQSHPAIKAPLSN